MLESDYLLNQPCPAGLALRVGWRLVDDDGGRCVVVLFGCSSRAARAVGIVAVVANEMFVFIDWTVQ